jgi:hypothetical protein
VGEETITEKNSSGDSSGDDSSGESSGQEDESDQMMVTEEIVAENDASRESSAEASGEEEESDPMVVTEEKSSSSEDEEGDGRILAKKKSSDDSRQELTHADFAVQLAGEIGATFAPRRSSRNISLKQKPSLKLLGPSKVTNSRGKPTPRRLFLLVSVKCV